MGGEQFTDTTTESAHLSSAVSHCLLSIQHELMSELEHDPIKDALRMDRHQHASSVFALKTTLQPHYDNILHAYLSRSYLEALEKTRDILTLLDTYNKPVSSADEYIAFCHEKSLLRREYTILKKTLERIVSLGNHYIPPEE